VCYLPTSCALPHAFLCAYHAFLCVQLCPVRTPQVKLETRIPAAFMSTLAAIVPGAAGINIEVHTCVCSA
jgi:hypothetical protein